MVMNATCSSITKVVSYSKASRVADLIVSTAPSSYAMPVLLDFGIVILGVFQSRQYVMFGFSPSFFSLGDVVEYPEYSLLSFD